MLRLLLSGNWIIYFYKDTHVQEIYYNAMLWCSIISAPVLEGKDISNIILAFRYWMFWEQEYARRGYRTISLEDYNQHNGDYTKLPWGIKRLPGENPIFHAIETSMKIKGHSSR